MSSYGTFSPSLSVGIAPKTSQSWHDDICEKIGQFVTMLWDLNLEIGHSVRTIEQAIEQKR
ncbi:MAG: hypothetical protein AAF492_07415, partial [Verrucomicrobiota bacterium]